MKRIKIFVAAALISIGAQNANAQALEQGNMIVEAYYGFPNLYGSVFKAAYANSGIQQNVKIGSLGPLGGRFEYMVADKFGLGIDIGFNNTKLTFTEFDGISNYDYNFSTRKIGFMVTFAYHFDFMPDNMDLSVGGGIGYGGRNFKFESTDPDYVPANAKSPIPVASRIGATYRFFFTDNLGFNLGLGFGQGGLINAGLSFKL